MRKFKFTTQIIILYFCLLSITTVLFGLIVLGRSKAVSDSQTFERLESFITVTKNTWQNGEEIGSTEIINIASIQGKAKYENDKLVDIRITYLSSRIDAYLKEEQIKDITSYISTFLSPGSFNNNYLDLPNKDRIYYTYCIENFDSVAEGDDFDFIIAITDSQIANTIRTEMAYQIIGIFGIVLTFAFLFLGLWGGNYVSRINRLKLHIANLPKTSYKEEYTDLGNDELSELSVSVEKMRHELLDNEAIKQEMLQNISHDFKTPIAVIKSYAEAIGDGVASISDTDIIIKQANILQHKVVRLLQYNRLEYLEKTEEFKDIVMKEIINDVVNTYRYQTKDITFNLNLDNTKFRGYAENFYTIIDNLVDNAKRYAKSRIDITLKKGVLTVYNDGKPISEQFLNALFKPYEKGSDGQFGLGMSIVKKTLEFFEYDLSVKNEEYGGVSFTIKKKDFKPIYTQ